MPSQASDVIFFLINTSTGLIRRGGNAIIKSSGAETMIGPGGSGIITFHNSSTMTTSDEKIRIDP